MDNNPVLMTNGSLMKLKSIAECSSVILMTCIQVITGLENQVLVFLSVFTVFN